MAYGKGKGKGKGKGGKKCAIAVVALPLVVAGCKSVPAVDPDTGEEIPGEVVIVPDEDVITATGTAVSATLPPPLNLILGALFASGGVAGAVAAYSTHRRRKAEAKAGEQSGG